MINYVFEYLEDKGVIFTSHEELENVTIGIKQYLLENGIFENDQRDYFKHYVCRVLAKVDRHDLKQFFLSYPIISRINQICIEFCSNVTPSDTKKKELLNSMAMLYSVGLGEKYVPVVEVKEILGKLA